MTDNLSYPLDQLDLAIVEELEIDGRQPVSALAKKLAAGEKVITRRLERLLNEHVIRVVAVPHPEALGYHARAYVMLNVRPTELNAVSEKLASYRSVHMVIVTAGIYDIVAMVLTHNLGELSTFLRQEVATIAGIDRMETSICVEIRKASMSYLSPDGHLFANGSVPGNVDHVWPELDELDLNIIKHLEQHGRRPITELSKQLGVSRPTTHKKLQTLLENGCIRVVALAFPRPMGYETMALIGLNPRLEDIDTTVEVLTSHPSVHSILITAGRYKIVISTWFRGPQELSDFLRINLGTELHLDNAEVLTIIDVRKARMTVPT